MKSAGNNLCFDYVIMSGISILNIAGGDVSRSECFIYPFPDIFHLFTYGKIPEVLVFL